MGRPSVKEKRTIEILDAFEKCVSKYGVEGSTLEKIAEAAGLRRSLLRHYIGNKEELLDALIERFITESDAQTDQMKHDLAGCDADDLVEYLFYDDGSENQTIRVAHALFLAAPDNPGLAKKLMDWSGAFDKDIAAILCRIFPKSPSEDCHAVAHGIVAIYANAASFTPIGDTTEVRSTAKKAAKMLISTIASN